MWVLQSLDHSGSSCFFLIGMAFSSLALCQRGFTFSDSLLQNDGLYLSPSPYFGIGLVSFFKELASYMVFILNILFWILKSFQTLGKLLSLFIGLSGSLSSHCLDLCHSLGSGICHESDPLKTSMRLVPSMTLATQDTLATVTSYTFSNSISCVCGNSLSTLTIDRCLLNVWMNYF